MKIYAVVEDYYDNCNFWETYNSYWFTEDQAILRQIKIEGDYKEQGLLKEYNWVHIEEITVEGDN